MHRVLKADERLVRVVDPLGEEMLPKLADEPLTYGANGNHTFLSPVGKPGA